MKAVPLHGDPPPPPPPFHVAIIMDGNGRWAAARGLPRTAGHRRGAEAARTVVEAAVEMGVGCLTLYGFSSENWSRPRAEVSDLMGLLRYYLRSEVENLDRNGVRLRVIGDRGRLAPDIVSLIECAEQQTADNAQLQLVMALNYGGRHELVMATRALADAVAHGALRPDEIDETVVARYLYTDGIPDPDLLIRTSGEKRISNFLLWQLAYTEFVFVETLWPDFSKEHFANAIREFQGRERRYGTTGL
jgi:undecaprenyl diphosphate synthase